ncbi:type I methionyl aminopeptidase [Spiribacter roseus]|uniref:type I methionyl aminopeptidase n=1 Tax=Spiribacter roseus TaxID=1855875 RepID=UPI000F6CD622|nr:type I methionyl aminopeptidase [Spiribacter roseus]
MTITTKSAAEIEKMREAGARAAAVLDMIAEHVRPGVTTAELDRLCHEKIDAMGDIPAPLNYRGFPKATCISVNHVICHGIPGSKMLKRGDILNIDVTVIHDGWHGDTSRMYFAGDPGVQARRVSRVAFDALHAGIDQVRPGARLGDIGHAIQTLAEAEGCSVVREYCGHGIGRGFHEDPQVLHHGQPGTGEVLKPGMTFTIEPMINAGRAETRLLGDQWTVVTKDHSLSAQWEHTVAVTDGGVDILTLSGNH